MSAANTALRSASNALKLAGNSLATKRSRPPRVTPAAVNRLKQLVQGPDPKLIRVGVKNKGCAGLSYALEYTKEKGKFDEEIRQDGVTVLIDSKSLFKMFGSEMDYVENRLSSKFVFNNPNVKESCGCGESFNI
ncbi:2190_t:CDS:2 [Diversispora eburnea]|uniref:Iron-sulfur assembly protein 1 n=1 Tax=Diversispora eburnea TaxID=1213867 RepID=A0A9N8WAJ0_9GLOM|nr:2190_t:CDS:2 [Diversispora eburnea]